MQRRLSAILSADVAGYSGLMEADEAGTLDRLKLNRNEVFDPCVAAHGGRLVKLIGDGALVEFPSVVAAVNCALAIQEGTAVAKTEHVEGQRIVYRIGTRGQKRSWRQVFDSRGSAVNPNASQPAGSRKAQTQRQPSSSSSQPWRVVPCLSLTAKP